jgi:hypothetical protein
VTGPPVARPPTQSAPPVKRAPRTTLVRTCDGEPVGRVPSDFANRIVSERRGHFRRTGDRQYVSLFSSVLIQRTERGWEMIEEARRLRGDEAVRGDIRHLDNFSLRWEAPPPLPPFRPRRSVNEQR